MVVAIQYHKDGIEPGGVLCSIMIEDHPTDALNKAYSLLKEIMPDEKWNIMKINYFPERVDTKSRLQVVASLKDYPLE